MAIRQFNQEHFIAATVGTTLFEREMNGYHDSDFYGTYWCMQQNKPIEIQFCTTRGGSTGACYIDATDEVKALYEQWQIDTDIKKERLRNVRKKLQLRKLRSTTGLTHVQFKKLVGAYDHIDSLVIICDELRKLKINSHRSKFKKSIAQSVYDWCSNESKYPRPLSYKQERAILQPPSYR